MAADQNGHIHVVWTDTRDEDYEIYYKRWNGIIWSEDLRLTNSPGDSFDPSIAVDLNGHIHIVWKDDRDGADEIYYKRWDGIAWSDDVRLTDAPEDATYPSIATDHHGDVHVVWRDRRDGNGEIYYKRWDGILWSPDNRLSYADGHSECPSIAIHLDGHVHVVWRDQRDGTHEIYYKSRPGTAGPPPALSALDPAALPDFGTRDITAFGENFIAPVELRLEKGGETTLVGTTLECSESHVVARFDLTRVAQGLWTAVAISGDGQRATLSEGLNVTQSPWGPEERLTSDPAGSSLTHNAGRAMCWDTPGTLHLFWYDARDGNQEIYWKTKTADIWGAEERLTISAGNSAFPVCAASPTGLVLAAWQDTRNGNAEMYSKLYDGNEWDDDVRVTDQPAPSQYPALTADPMGTFHLVWEDGRDGNWEIYYNRCVGGLWDFDQRLTSDASSSRYPSVACDAAGNVYVAWADDRDGNWEIYSKVWNGFDWSTDQRLTEAPGISLDPSLGTDTAEGIYVVWKDDRDGNSEIYLRRIDIIDTDHRLTYDSALSANPILSATDDGDLHVFWSDTRTSIEQIWYKTCSAGEWSLDHRASGSTASASLPSVVTGPSQVIDLVWRDQRDGNYEIYALARGAGMSSVEDGFITLGSLHVTCAPNPFRLGATFAFGAPLQAGAQFAIYDPNGRRVRLLLTRTAASGVERQSWDGRDDHGSPLSAGVYFYRLLNDGEIHAGRIIRVR